MVGWGSLSLIISWIFIEGISELGAVGRTFAVKENIVPYSETSIKRTPIKRTPIKRTPSIKWTLSRVPKLTSCISLYNEPLFSGHLY